jgi:hypothetical protein
VQDVNVNANLLQCPRQSEEIDEKKVMFASARCSAILATLNPSISKLSGSGWVQKVR